MKPQIQTGVSIALIILGVLLAAWLFIKLSALVLIVLIAIVITNGIAPIVLRLQRAASRRWFRMPRAVATLLIMLAILGIFSSIILALAFTAFNEAETFSQDTWPQLQVNLLHWLSGLAHRYSFIPAPDVILRRLSTQTDQIVSYLWSTTQAIFGFLGGLFLLVTAFIMTFFFTMWREAICYHLRLFIPARYHARVIEVSMLASEKMGGWLRGQVTLAMIITALIMLGMAVLGVPYAALLGLIGGMGELVPMVGPYLAFLPALLVTIAIGGPLWKIIAVIIFFITLAQVEGYVLVPTVMKRHVGLNPVTTLLALLTGGTLLGLVGALLAIPLTAAARVILLEAVFPAIQGKSRAEIEQGLLETEQHACDDDIGCLRTLPTVTPAADDTPPPKAPSDG